MVRERVAGSRKNMNTQQISFINEERSPGRTEGSCPAALRLATPTENRNCRRKSVTDAYQAHALKEKVRFLLPPFIIATPYKKAR